MATVTYKAQPGVHATRGAIPLAGTTHLYTVTRVLWPKDVEAFLRPLLIGRSLHVCSGHSRLGDTRLDNDAATVPDILADAPSWLLAAAPESFDTVLCDPPYNGRMQWNHDLLEGLARVARQRIVFQHWFVPATMRGYYRKAQERFRLTALYGWQPRTYFGRFRMVSIFDRVEKPAPKGDQK